MPLISQVHGAQIDAIELVHCRGAILLVQDELTLVQDQLTLLRSENLSTIKDVATVHSGATSRRVTARMWEFLLHLSASERPRGVSHHAGFPAVGISLIRMAATELG